VIGIVDLEMGNLRSVANAVAQCGAEARWVRNPADLEGATHLILPGVGAFRTAVDALDLHGLRQPLTAWAAAGKPLLGICLGMQLLASEGAEGGSSRGLGLVPGRVVRLDPSAVDAIPHVGWNEAKFARKHSVFERVKNRADFYYVHSFHFAVDDPANVLATFEYSGGEYVSVVARASVVGTQFHPEKSQVSGLRVIENFCYWDGQC
jgi:imidazole glycerol-phosphate synthase subunit HisH